METTHTTPPYIPQIRLYQNWLRDQRGLQFDSYDALWRWSTTDLDAFWQSVWDYFDLQSPTPHTAVLAKNTMPGAVWFPGAQVNYARQALRHVDAAHAAGLPAIISRNEKGQHRELSWPELRRQVASLALHLKAQEIEPGRVNCQHFPGSGRCGYSHRKRTNHIRMQLSKVCAPYPFRLQSETCNLQSFHQGGYKRSNSKKRDNVH